MKITRRDNTENHDIRQETQEKQVQLNIQKCGHIMYEQQQDSFYSLKMPLLKTCSSRRPRAGCGTM
jgi:hypothetical protein